MSAAWEQARRLLCMRLDSLGDVLMCTPALRALKHGGAGRHVTLLGSPAGLAAAPYLPEVDAVLAYEAPWMKHGEAHGPGTDLDMIGLLREQGFDAAVIFTSYSQSPLPAAMLATLAGIPLRLAHCRENPYRLLTDWIPDPEPHAVIRHEVRRQLDLVARIGSRTGQAGLSFRLGPADLDWAACRLAALGLAAGQPWILLHPGATAASRRYPPAHWASLARQIVSRLHLPVVLTGSAEELPLAHAIRARSGVPAHVLAGEADLGQLGALIRLASVVVVGNTGPAHMAAAIGTPLVVLYAQTNPQHAPWQARSRVLFQATPCAPCYKSDCAMVHHDCLEKVLPGQVLEAIAQLLGGCGTQVPA